MSAVLQANVAADRKAFYDRIDKANVTPLWEVLHGIITPTPNTPCKPHLWKWDQMWPWIQEAGRLITAKEAERRVLVLENPGLRGRSSITHSLYAGLQLILPGEVAPAHRHSQSALRFILLGSGAYTAVDGEKVSMSVGDFVITPSWTFHDHGNPSREPMVWLDGLDVPLVELLGAQFREKGPQEVQHTRRTEGDNLAQFGNTMKPVEYRVKSRTSPLFWYPYGRTREALETMREAQDAPLLGPQAAIHQSGDGRLGDADDRHLHAAPAEGIQRQRVSFDRFHGVRGGRGQRPLPLRRRDARLRAKRRVRLPFLAVLQARSRRTGGAFQLFGPPGAAGARSLARSVLSGSTQGGRVAARLSARLSCRDSLRDPRSA